jgi:glycogen operon protein
MAKLRKPPLELGNLLRLVQELHRLHEDAGWPSMRRIADKVKVSHTTVHELFTKPRSSVPNKILVIRVAGVLASIAGEDVKAVATHIADLWSLAEEQPFAQPPVSRVREGLRVDRLESQPVYGDGSPAVWPNGIPPLGATYGASETLFAVYSKTAKHVEVCLIDSNDQTTDRRPLERTDGHVWYTKIENVKPGQRYGYRVSGPDAPQAGHRFNSQKLLLDPYAKAISGGVSWDDAVFGYEIHGNPDNTNSADSAPFVPKSIVVANNFNWKGDSPLRIPYADTVIYEAHVRGMTALHPAVSKKEQGKFLGLASVDVMQHLCDLGITAIQLMPVHHFIHARHLLEKGLTNYWGYDTIGYFAPHSEYAVDSTPGAQVAEFKEMVRRIHAAGLEVIIDVVFNHTGEGSHLGPTLSMRGIDNVTYYRLDHSDKSKYANFTNTGNALNAAHSQVAKLITDSLRYWILEMHIDGFRFDLAPVLTRDFDGDFTTRNPFLAIVEQDSVINQAKLIAEPWDTGPGGYRVGTFPHPWMEWNDRFRDGVRRFWGGWGNSVGDFATRILGSADIYEKPHSTMTRSINFVTCHDGFTLTDLVTYKERKNDANGEDGKDGQVENFSKDWLDAAENSVGEVDVATRRERVKRAMLASLAISRGVPMLLYGDEFGRTQAGNNNAYCQDTRLSWVDWSLIDMNGDLLEFTKAIFKFRRDNRAVAPLQFASGFADVRWFSASGSTLTDKAWTRYSRPYLGLYVRGEAGLLANENPSHIILCNASNADMSVVIPRGDIGHRWVVVVDTADPYVAPPREILRRDVLDYGVIEAASRHSIPGNSLQILRCIDGVTAAELQ